MILSGFLLDVVFLAVVALTAWFVSRRLVIDSAILLLTTLFASVIAMVTFEYIAGACRDNFLSDNDFVVANYLWIFFLLGIFGLSFLILQQIFSRAIGRPPELGRIAESLGCWVIGGLTGYVLAAFLLVAAQTAPGTRSLGGTLYPEATRRPGPVMSSGPDYQYLTMVEYSCKPRFDLTLESWQLGRPVVSAALGLGQWPSFIIRYALWREELAIDDDNIEEEPIQNN